MMSLCVRHLNPEILMSRSNRLPLPSRSLTCLPRLARGSELYILPRIHQRSRGAHRVCGLQYNMVFVSSTLFPWYTIEVMPEHFVNDQASGLSARYLDRLISSGDKKRGIMASTCTLLLPEPRLNLKRANWCVIVCKNKIIQAAW